MVEDRVTDGKRIAQLLASELSGRDRGTLGDVGVVDADPDAEPSPDGTVAYGVEFRGERVGTVRIYPHAAAMTMDHRAEAVTDAAAETVTDAAHDTGLSIPESGTVRVESGAAVKRAVDALVAGLSESD